MNAPGMKPGPGHANAATARPASIRSMTGYAQARTVEHGRSLRISVRSVNHRFLDLHLHVPEGFEPVEPRMRQLVREHLRRGHVDVTLHYELEGAAAVGVNREIAAAYLQAANSLRAEFDIQAEPIFIAVIARSLDVRRAGGTVEGSLITAHVRPVERGEQADGARVAVDGEATLKFNDHRPSFEVVGILRHSI